MKTFLEWLGDDSTKNPYYGDIAHGLNEVSVDLFKKTCKSFGLDWKIEGGDVLVGSTFRPGADNVGMDVARQATLVLNDVPGGNIEHVGRGHDGKALTRYLMGVKDGAIWVRRSGVDPNFIKLLGQ